MEYKYDVALSFAGEDREYVEKVADILTQNNVKVFYDKFEEVDLWGKDLGIHFDYVYRKAAKYCVPFISKNYKEKIWTNHEIKTSISRAIQSNEEYILPARFDDTEIEGIRPTIGYLNLKKYSPEQFSVLLLKKLQKEPSVPIVEKEQSVKDNIYCAVKILISGFYGFSGVAIGVTITNVEKEYRYFNEPYFTFSSPLEGNKNSFSLLDKLEHITFPKKLEFGEVCSVDYSLKPLITELMEKLPPKTTFRAVVTTTVGEKYFSNEVEVKDILDGFNLK